MDNGIKWDLMGGRNTPTKQSMSETEYKAVLRRRYAAKKREAEKEAFLEMVASAVLMIDAAAAFVTVCVIAILK